MTNARTWLLGVAVALVATLLPAARTQADDGDERCGCDPDGGCPCPVMCATCASARGTGWR